MTGNLCHLKRKCVLPLFYLQWFPLSCSFFHHCIAPLLLFWAKFLTITLDSTLLPSFPSLHVYRDILKACVSDRRPLHSFFFIPFLFFIRELQFLAGHITAIIKNILSTLYRSPKRRRRHCLNDSLSVPRTLLLDFLLLTTSCLLSPNRTSQKIPCKLGKPCKVSCTGKASVSTG